MNDDVFVAAAVCSRLANVLSSRWVSCVCMYLWYIVLPNWPAPCNT